MDSIEIDSLAGFFGDTVKKDSINYLGFLKAYYNPKIIGEIDAFKDTPSGLPQRPSTAFNNSNYNNFTGNYPFWRQQWFL